MKNKYIGITLIILSGLIIIASPVAIYKNLEALLVLFGDEFYVVELGSIIYLSLCIACDFIALILAMIGLKMAFTQSK